LVALASDRPVVDRRGEYCLTPHGLDAALGSGISTEGVVYAPAGGRRHAKPNLIRVPVRPRGGFARDETWFRVETRWWRR
jgi:hypothetical protein